MSHDKLRCRYAYGGVHLDFIGLLPKTLKGIEHILMMVDQFFKWVECIPLPSQTAEVTETAATNEFFTRFGYAFTDTKYLLTKGEPLKVICSQMCVICFKFTNQERRLIDPQLTGKSSGLTEH